MTTIAQVKERIQDLWKKPRRSCSVYWTRAVALGLEAADAAPVELLARFDAVLIEDSSTIRLPDKLADLWQSCGGGPGQCQAGLKLHVRWDLKQGGLQGPLLTPSRVADQSSPLRKLGIAAGVLNITDEAYCSLEWLRTQPGMFLSRPRSTVCFLDRESEQVLDLEQIGPQAVGHMDHFDHQCPSREALGA
ncbi:MAG: hypothetical protein NVSMB27_48490 [Ktedonobacteraceae bacterium]